MTQSPQACYPLETPVDYDVVFIYGGHRAVEAFFGAHTRRNKVMITERGGLAFLQSIRKKMIAERKDKDKESKKSAITTKQQKRVASIGWGL